jgi:hypothetical protein
MNSMTTSKLVKWIAGRPSIEILSAIYLRLNPVDLTQVDQPTSVYAIEKSFLEGSFRQYWTGKERSTAKTKDNRWTTKQHQAICFGSISQAERERKGSETCTDWETKVCKINKTLLD